MTIYLMRHAKAGSRSGWDGADEQRPLSKSGRRQTSALTEALADASITRIYSSPYVRCVQTVEPLAERLGIPLDLSDGLAEGAGLTDALELVEKYADEETVLCSHGDVIGDLLHHYEQRGVALDGDKLEKGSTWILDFADGVIVTARYVPPPA
ncbi:MAG: histidine phosphatase family protein [Acidimicrobiia bacterium]|nr:histidine phosphatase family protein [Acidimicrobiia bacterium]